jgi:hypothetical protein
VINFHLYYKTIENKVLLFQICSHGVQTLVSLFKGGSKHKKPENRYYYYVRSFDKGRTYIISSTQQGSGPVIWPGSELRVEIIKLLEWKDVAICNEILLERKDRSGITCIKNEPYDVAADT